MPRGGSVVSVVSVVPVVAGGVVVDGPGPSDPGSSASPSVPDGRVNTTSVERSSTISVTTKTSMFVTTVTRVMFAGEKPDQRVPVNVGAEDVARGSSRGLPQAQRTRGTPRSSTRTAVPASSTLWREVARPSRNPWFVTRVSKRNRSGVRDSMKSGMEATVMAWTSAHASALAALAGSVRNSMSCCRSQVDWSCVPP